MDITWLGKRCFKIVTGGATLLVDPVGLPREVLQSVSSVDVVTLSLRSPGSDDYRGLPGEPRVIDGPGEFEIASVYIRGIGSASRAANGDKALNTVYLVNAEGLTVCHLGGLLNVPTNRQTDEFSSADLLFVPIGESASITPKEAADITSAISPGIVVPMSYQAGRDSFADALASFSKEIGAREVDRRSKLSVTRSNVPTETRLVVLEKAS